MEVTTPKEDNEELAAAALLIFNGRTADQIVEAVVAASAHLTHGKWDIWRAVNKAVHAVPVSTLCADDIRTRLTMDYSGEDYDEEIVMSDEEIYHELDMIDVPDSVSEAMYYAVRDLLDALRSKGLIRRVEKPHDTIGA